MRYEALVGYVAECLVERAEASVKQFVQVFDEEDRGAFVDTAFNVYRLGR
jgi:hypothetical protein